MKNELRQNVSEIMNAMINTHGYLFCQYCDCSNKVLAPPHHIIFRSEIPGHPERHNIRNLILLCYDCHDKFHGKIKDFHKQEMRKELVKKRGLKELFNLSRD